MNVQETIRCGLKITKNARKGIEQWFLDEQAFISSEPVFDIYIEKNPANRQGNTSFSFYFDPKTNEKLAVEVKQRVAVLECVLQPDGLLATGFHVRGEREPVRTNRRLQQSVTFLLDRPGILLPIEFHTRLRDLPVAEERSEYVRKRIESWEGYLQIAEKNADVEDLACSFTQASFNSDFTKLQLVCSDLQAKNWKQLRGFSVRMPGLSADVGQITDSHKGRKTIEIELNRRHQQKSREGQWLPANDKRVVLTNFAELSQIRRLRKGFKDLQDGFAANANLERLLFEERPVVQINPKKLELEFHNTLNEYQREAVTGAMKAHDLYVIQGPPGTGKTTVISEICYQNVKAGLRTLVASQSNLAVDNALGRLLSDPATRILRYGRTESIEEEGRKFIEENIAVNWRDETLETVRATRTVYQNKERELQEAIRNFRQTIESCKESEASLAEQLDFQRTLRDRLAEINGQQAAQQEKFKQAAAQLKQTVDQHTDSSYLLTVIENMLQEQKSALEELPEKLRTFHSAHEQIAEASILSDLQERIKASQIEPPIHLILGINELQRLIRAIETDHYSYEYQEWKELQERFLKAIGKTEKLLMKYQYPVDSIKKGSTEQYTTLQDMHEMIDRLGKFLIHPKTKHAFTINGPTAEKTDILQRIAKGLSLFYGKLDTVRIKIESIQQEQIALSKKRFVEVKQELLDWLLAERQQYERKRQELQLSIEDLTGMEMEMQSLHEAMGELAKEKETAEGQLDDGIGSRLENTAAERQEAEDRLQELSEEIEQLPVYLSLQEQWEELLCGATEQDLNEIRKLYVEHANVIGTTCVASASRTFMEEYPVFDVVIIDEVSKATPPELLLPMLKGKKIILVGDHHQLPPLVGQETMDEFVEQQKDPEVRKEMKKLLNESLFERLFRTLPKQNKTMLSIQYRMHENIMQMIAPFYKEGNYELQCGLTDSDSMRDHRLCSPTVQRNDHLVWLDTPNELPYFEEKVTGGTSRFNEAELQLIKEQLQELEAAVQSAKEEELMEPDAKKSVGIISFYGEQVKRTDRLIQELKPQHLHCRTGSVDKFQGMEMDVIILSFVRNHKEAGGDIGFAKDYRRLNVALSRARELLIIVGSSEMFAERTKQPAAREMYGQLRKTIEDNGGLRKVQPVGGA